MGPRRRDSTIANYRRAVEKDLGDWLDRPLDDIDRRDVERRFGQITERAGWVQANIAVKLLAAIYRRPCLDFDDLRDPVQLSRSGGGRLHRPRRRRIQPPAEVLPRWHRGFETAVRNCFITVADRELMLPTSLTKRLVNHAPSQDITEGYAADWTMVQLRHAARRIADRIDELALRAGFVAEAPSKTASSSLAVSTTTYP